MEIFGRILDKIGLIPTLLLGFAVMAALTAVMLFIFFKMPVKKGGVYGGLNSMTPEQRAEYDRLEAEWLAARAAERAAREAEANALDADVEIVTEEPSAGGDLELPAETAEDSDAEGTADAEAHTDAEEPADAEEPPSGAEKHTEKEPEILDAFFEVVTPEGEETGPAAEGR